MTSRTEAAAGALAHTLGREESKRAKTVVQDFEQMVEESKLGKRAAESPHSAAHPPTAKVVGHAPVHGPGGVTRKAAVEDIKADFEADVELNSNVEAARKKSAKNPELTDRERQIERNKRLAADNPKEVNRLLRLGLEPDQARTLDQLLGQFWGQTIPVSGRAATQASQKEANALIAELKAIWDTSGPRGKTTDAALADVYAKLQAELKRVPGTNRSTFVRDKLFDPWRVSFMERLGSQESAALRARLEKATGLKVVVDGGTPKFRLTLKVGKTKQTIGFDVDHGEKRLADAVRDAKSAEDLLPVIDSKGMQLLTPRENRQQIEALRKADRAYVAQAAEAAASRGAQGAASAEQLNDYLDEVLATLDKPRLGDPDYF